MDEFLFGGYKSGSLKILQDKLIGLWNLDEAPQPDCDSSELSCYLCSCGFCYPAVRKPSVIQVGDDGEFRFAALNTKSDTTHNE